MAWPNLPSALARHRGATAAPFLAAFDSHLALAATFVATASIFFELHLLATNAPPVLPVTVRVMSSTNASTSEAFRLVGGPLAGRVVLGRRTFATRSAGHVRREDNEREENHARPDRCPRNQAA